MSSLGFPKNWIHFNNQILLQFRQRIQFLNFFQNTTLTRKRYSFSTRHLIFENLGLKKFPALRHSEKAILDIHSVFSFRFRQCKSKLNWNFFKFTSLLRCLNWNKNPKLKSGNEYPEWLFRNECPSAKFFMYYIIT